jgi:TonB family protein
MPEAHFIKVQFILVLLCATVGVPSFARQDAIKSDFSKESVVIEQSMLKIVFHNDGTYTQEQHVRARIQSDAGVRQYGVLPFSYISSIGNVEVEDVRVIKPNGSVVTTRKESVQDVTPEIYRDAPMYSDLREKHLAVKGLEPGDVLEYSAHWKTDKPLIPGQFWTSVHFVKSSVVLDEQLEINVPHDREIKIKSRTIQPTVREENGWRIYVWKTANLESQSVEEQKRAQAYYAIRGMLSQPDVLISSFRTWEEVGRWYETLQKEKIEPSPQVIAKAEELTKGLSDDDAKLRAIYNYVSVRYRYVAIALGIGRYQPHAAGEILGNQYGDCKDKHTLLAALLKAVGIQAYPALISNLTTVDLDVPSPGQFNHVISVVLKGDTVSWMDTTPEVTPFGYLINALRSKPALVIMPNNISFRATPANPPFNSDDNYTVTAKLDPDGTLHAHVQGTDRGDNELAFRYIFRQLPESEWKDFARKSFYGARLGGTIDSIRPSLPDKTDEPFRLAYDYTLKDFSEADKHRFVVPLSPFNIPEINDEDLSRKTPLWIGQVGESQYESHIELPKGWSVTPPSSIDLKESFAEFHESSELKEGVLLTRRRLVLKANEVSPEQLKSYKAFRKAIADRHDTYIFMHIAAETAGGSAAVTPAQGMARVAELLREGIRQLPGSSNPEALQAERDGFNAVQSRGYAAAITNLKRATSLDPKFSRAWIMLGLTYAGKRDANSAITALQNAVESAPTQVLPYKILAFLYVGLGRQDDAIATWQKLQSLAPEDRDLWSNLSRLYISKKRYAEATLLLESAAKANPSDPYVQLALGTARLRSNETDLGLEALHKALEIQSNAEMLNDVAYELAEADTHLPDAVSYSQRSLNEIEAKLQKIDPANIRKEDLQLTAAIGAYWDTLGWIYFKMGNLPLAESNLRSAWELAQDGVIGYHLGQLYEKEHELPEALHMYNLALEASPDMTETQARMRTLAHVPLPEHRMSAGEELSWMRTTKLPKIIDIWASADFDLLIAPSGKVENAVFVAGSELLRNAAKNLQEMSFTEALPGGSTAYLRRRGVLSCDSACSFVFYPPFVAVSRFEKATSASVHEGSSPSPAGATVPGGVFHVGGGVTPPRAVYSPQPEYSEQARKAHFQGVCTLGIIVEKDGHPSHIRVLKGLGMGLDENAIEAVKSWKFEPAMKDGNPVRVEIAVEVSFHLFQRSGNPN